MNVNSLASLLVEMSGACCLEVLKKKSDEIPPQLRGTCAVLPGYTVNYVNQFAPLLAAPVGTKPVVGRVAPEAVLAAAREALSLGGVLSLGGPL